MKKKEGTRGKGLQPSLLRSLTLTATARGSLTKSWRSFNCHLYAIHVDKHRQPNLKFNKQSSTSIPDRLHKGKTVLATHAKQP
jgi:hypothetical protein